jgi:hypothetical protein
MWMHRRSRRACVMPGWVPADSGRARVDGGHEPVRDRGLRGGRARAVVVGVAARPNQRRRARIGSMRCWPRLRRTSVSALASARPSGFTTAAGSWIGSGGSATCRLPGRPRWSTRRRVPPTRRDDRPSRPGSRMSSDRLLDRALLERAFGLLADKLRARAWWASCTCSGVQPWCWRSTRGRRPGTWMRCSNPMGPCSPPPGRSPPSSPFPAHGWTTRRAATSLAGPAAAPRCTTTPTCGS